MKVSLVAPAGARIAAIVVAFGPDKLQFNTLLRLLVDQCGKVYVMDNGGGHEAVDETLHSHKSIQIVNMNGNKGMGEALNDGFQLAAAAKFEFVTTFDQDSEPTSGQIASLMDAMQALASKGNKVAAVGPFTTDIRGQKRLPHPFMRRRMGWPVATYCTGDCECIRTDFLITSGSLISMSAYSAIGGYDSGLFVDYVDMEWCFRALHLGYRLFGICSVAMIHELSTGVSARALGLTLLGYGPVRRYYYARNVTALLQRSYVAAGWKMRLLFGLIARVLLLPAALGFSSGWYRHWFMLIRGIAHGVTGVRGSYPGLLKT